MTTETFESIVAREPLTAKQLKMIAGSLGPIQSMVLRLGEVDLAAGAGTIDGQTKCVWTKDGRRIRFNYAAGTFVGSVSNGADPDKPSKAAGDGTGTEA